MLLRPDVRVLRQTAQHLGRVLLQPFNAYRRSPRLTQTPAR